MFKDPEELAHDLNLLENIEKLSMRFVCQAIFDFAQEAVKIYTNEGDKQGDIGEDITREALDSVGVSKIPCRIFGKMDYKKARYIFHEAYALRQALLVDSKAEKEARVARIQTSQVSMAIRQVRSGTEIDVPGKLPTYITVNEVRFLTTTIFVKYCYVEIAGTNKLKTIIIACIPNGMLQNRYNPTPQDTIWQAGPNAPTLGEDFRTRLDFRRLKEKCNWRVQRIHIEEEITFDWDN